jgi:DNA-binding SARP family transcriptional activator/Tfp pilus assembly protein PilF
VPAGVYHRLVGVRIRLLGPVGAWDGQRAIALGPRKQRLVFAVLALEAGRAVDVARLVDLAWPEDPPRTAQHAIQVCVSGLRSALRGADGLDVQLAGSGYLLAADRSAIDAHRFRSLLAGARAAATDAAGDEARVALLDEALVLWSGDALAGTATPAVAERLCAGLEEARLGALEDRLDALLRRGRHREVLDELRGLVAAHPLRERLAGQLMTALYRDGRAADALDEFRRYRQRLAEDLGLDAGPALRELELAILRNEASPEPGEARPHPGDGRAAGTPVPAQLPSAVAGFAGRDSDLTELDALLSGAGRAGQVVVIAGTAGVGKTALAVHWAHRHRDDFPDGQLYVNLAGYAPAPPLPPERALAGFLRALGVPAERIPPEVDEAAALYRSLLADRRVLVVLDNARGPDQVRPLLPGGAGCLTVITSRDRLAGLAVLEGARLLPLGVLSPGEALAVLAAGLGADRVGADPDAAADVAALCACLPLALRIAAAHLSRHARQPLSGLAAELREGNRLSVLSVAGDEQSAVRGSFDLSYTALRPAARRMFLLAGLSPGGALSTRAAAALAAGPADGARAVLADLTEAHLMDEEEPGRFGMHDLLRLYAGDRALAELGPQEREAAIGRLCDFYLRATTAAARVLYPNMQRLPLPARLGDPAAVADRDTGAAFGGHADALDWLETERANLVTTVTWAAGHGPREAAWLIADAMRGYFWMRRYAADWLAVAAAGLAAAGPAGSREDDGEPRAMAAAHISLAQAERLLTRYDVAADHLEQAAALARRAGWQQGTAAAFGSLANVYRDQGRMAESADNHRRALEVYRATGGRGGEATSLVNLGNVLLETGNAADAVAHLEQALAIHREIGARTAEGNVLNSLGCAHLIQGATQDAQRYFDAALAVHRETGSLEGEADDLSNMAESHIDAGRLDRARELAMASLALARRSGERRIEIDANNALGTTARHSGDLATAFRHHQEALKFAAEAGYRQGETVALTGLAQDLAGLGDYDSAVSTAGQALDVARQTRLRLLEGHALVALASISLDGGRRADARAHAAAALAVHRETGHVPGQSRAERLLDLLDET